MSVKQHTASVPHTAKNWHPSCHSLPTSPSCFDKTGVFPQFCHYTYPVTVRISDVQFCTVPATTTPLAQASHAVQLVVQWTFVWHEASWVCDAMLCTHPGPCSGHTLRAQCQWDRSVYPRPMRQYHPQSVAYKLHLVPQQLW